jgi:hypothetical protein
MEAGPAVSCGFGKVRTLVRLLLAAALFVPTILLLDGPGLVRQGVLGAATALFLALVVRVTRVDARQIVLAILIATTGEAVLSLGWGLYEYRHAAIPLYVPFGHGVFYALAAATAPRLQRHARRIVPITLVAGSVIAAVSYFALDDEWGLLWWIAAAALIARSRNALLLSICFAMTVALEWLGTGLGNWTWAAEVPGLGVHAANPPSGVGILYVVLDALTLYFSGMMPGTPSAIMSPDAGSSTERIARVPSGEIANVSTVVSRSNPASARRVEAVSVPGTNSCA